MHVILGDWTNELDVLKLRYENATPFPFVVLEPFVDFEQAFELSHSFPRVQDANWHKYDNPLEKKYALNAFGGVPVFESFFNFLQSPAVVDLFKSITGIPDLENDPHLHGAGLHYHQRGGKLDMHLDYSIHPLSKKERRVNLILYLNEHWDDAYNGGLELWDAAFTRCCETIMPAFNRAVLFQTSDISYHGLPTPITCPPDTGRKSLAIYYVSHPREGVVHRTKAQFRPLPHQPVSPPLQLLYDIRPTRIISEHDLETIYPQWKEDPAGKGFWFL
jgi:hypothetical protein